MGFNTIIGFLIFLFILKQLYDLVKYFILLREHPEDKRKFPILSALIFGGCILFYLIAFLVDYSSTSTPAPTRTRTPDPNVLPTPKPASLTRVAQIAQELTPNSQTSCYLWSEITPSMQGQQICVYGTVVDYQENPTLNASYLYFGTRNQFFLVISDRYFIGFKEGECAQAEGIVELNTYKTPYIKIDELFFCENSVGSPDYTNPLDNSDYSGCPDGCSVHPQGCDIKGNISFDSGERIYHVPGQEYYATTTINPAYGERWFCTEAEARANGWRKSYQ